MNWRVRGSTVILAKECLTIFIRILGISITETLTDCFRKVDLGFNLGESEPLPVNSHFNSAFRVRLATRVQNSDVSHGHVDIIDFHEGEGEIGNCVTFLHNSLDDGKAFDRIFGSVETVRNSNFAYGHNAPVKRHSIVNDCRCANWCLLRVNALKYIVNNINYLVP